MQKIFKLIKLKLFKFHALKFYERLSLFQTDPGAMQETHRKFTLSNDKTDPVSHSLLIMLSFKRIVL